MNAINPTPTILQELEVFLPFQVANLVTRYAESLQERVDRIKKAIISFDPDFDILEGLKIKSDALPWGDVDSIGADISQDENAQYGYLHVTLSYHVMAPRKIKFFEYLAKDSEITLFDGRGCFQEGVADAIATCLSQNQTLKILELENNAIDPEGTFKIVDALEQNTSLKFLNIRNNSINNKILARMLEILKTNKVGLICFCFARDWNIKKSELDIRLIRQIEEQLQANALRLGHTKLLKNVVSERFIKI